MANKKIIIATTNAGKVKELKPYLVELGYEVLSLKDFENFPPIIESGKNFLENALIKAVALHHATGLEVIADDSGIECEDLDGAPGLYSARFAGPHATDEENNQKLIDQLNMKDDPSRRARYVCALAHISSSGNQTLFQETCEGVITLSPGGTNGFGYDPYFYLPEKKCTMAELNLEEKNKISHRGKALKQLLAFLGYKK